ncbi:MAG: transporter substrate-binding domain-containing protein [Ekhidna sp.]
MRIFGIAIYLLFHFTCESQTLEGDTWEKAVRTGKASIVITHAESLNYAKVINGVNEGICFEIMDHFVEYVESSYGIDLTVEYKPLDDPTNFNAFIELMKKSRGGVFGIGDISITDDRKSYFEYSPPYISNVSLLITSKPVSNLSSIENIGTEFAGMTCVVQNGTSHHKWVTKLQKEYGGFDIAIVKNTKAKLDLVMSSPRYFSYVDFSRYLENVLNGDNIKRHPAGDDSGEKFGLIMPKGSDWSPIMSAFFNRNGGYTSGTKYRKALKDNLGEKMVRLTDYITKIESEAGSN